MATEERKLQMELTRGANDALNSHVGHEFEVRELPSVKTGVCRSEDQTCRTANFVVSGNNDQRKLDRAVGRLFIFSSFILSSNGVAFQQTIIVLPLC